MRRIASTQSGPRLLIAGVILALSVFYALALFCGLEWHGGYFGRTYKALHPESFPGNVYMSMNPVVNPVSFSSYYWLVSMVGDVWLDDRFTLIVYWMLVILALVGVDKTAQVLGATRVAERLFILGLMAFGHGFRDSFGQIVTNADFYAGTFAAVIGIWVFYLMFAGSSVWKVAGWLIVMWSFAPKAAWLPTVIVASIAWKERLGRRGRRIALGLTALVCAVVGLIYYRWLRPPGNDHTLLFDYLAKLDGSESNPFLDRPVANLLYFLLLGLGMWMTPPAPHRRRIRTVAVVGVLLWGLSGLYLTCAPDALKIPYLIPLAFNRATQWVDYLLFVSISVGTLIALRDSSLRVSRRFGFMVVLGALYATFSPVRMVKFSVMAVLVLAVFLLTMSRGRRNVRMRAPMPAVLVEVLAWAAVCSTLFAYARGVVVRYPHLRFLAEHGVIGHNAGAKWVEVNAYIREHTPLHATLLALTSRVYPHQQPGLYYDRSVGIRTGRTSPSGAPWAVPFDYEKLQRLEEEDRHMAQLVAAWKDHNLDDVREQLEYFDALYGGVDYLIIERPEAQWLRGRSFNYLLEASVGKFAIYRRGRAG